MFWKKKKKFNLYLDEVDMIENEDDLLDEELLGEQLPDEEIELASLQDTVDDKLIDDDLDPADIEPADLDTPDLDQAENDPAGIVLDDEPVDLGLDDESVDLGLDDDSDDIVLDDEPVYLSLDDDLDETSSWLPDDEADPLPAEEEMALSETDLLEESGDPDAAVDDVLEPLGDGTSKKGKGLLGRFKKKDGSKSDSADQNKDKPKDKAKKKKKKRKRKRKKNKNAAPKLNLPFIKKKDEPGTGSEDETDQPKKKLTRKKIAIIAGAAALVLGLCIFFIIRNLGGDSDTKVYVESVGELTGLGSANGMSNRYSGEVEAQDSWKISLVPDLSVKECYVNVGDEVKKGDKLFSYNTEEIKLNKEKKELEVETLTNEMTQLRKDIAGYEKDLKSANASEKIELQTQILTAQTTIKKDEFTIKASKEEIKNLQKNIKEATVKSKMDGLVKSINKSLANPSGSDSGDDSSSSSYDDNSGDSTYMTILALGDYRIKGTISETNVWMLHEGDPVIVRSRVDDKQTWSGAISKIKTDSNADSGQNNADTDYDTSDSGITSATKYNFYVSLESAENLMLGQHVLIEPDNGQDAEREGMWLNAAYLHKEGDKYYVWAANKRDRLTLRRVKVGSHNEELDDYEILDGLSITDYIASDSPNLHENMKVTKAGSEADSSEYYDEEANDDQLYLDGPEPDMDDSMDDSDMFVEDSGGQNSSGSGGELVDDGSGFGPDVLDEQSGSGNDSKEKNDDSLVTID